MDGHKVHSVTPHNISGASSVYFFQRTDVRSDCDVAVISLVT